MCSRSGQRCATARMKNIDSFRVSLVERVACCLTLSALPSSFPSSFLSAKLRLLQYVLTTDPRGMDRFVPGNFGEVVSRRRRHHNFHPHATAPVGGVGTAALGRKRPGMPRVF